MPVHNIVDNLNWTKGNHNFQVGGNWRLVHQNRTSDANSFTNASTNPYWLGGSPPDPSSLGLTPVDSGFGNSYVIAYANLIGTVPSVTNLNNYQVTNATTGTLLSDGALIGRHFKANEFEYYLQDSWRATPNLTFTFGLRHTILQTPYETKGQQVAPTIDTHAWFMQRESAAQQGQIYEPDLQFQPNGSVYGRPGYWAKSKNNIAPRFAVVYSPNSKTSIRAGAGEYFDHYGEGLVNTFDQKGSFGLSSSLTNQGGTYGYDTAPRFVSRRSFPFSNGSAPPTVQFPYTAPEGLFNITWGLDNKLKTPYTESFDFSVQRELPGGFTLETSYVGRLGRHLLQSLDLAEPTDLWTRRAAAITTRLVRSFQGWWTRMGATTPRRSRPFLILSTCFRTWPVLTPPAKARRKLSIQTNGHHFVQILGQLQRWPISIFIARTAARPDTCRGSGRTSSHRCMPCRPSA